MILATASGLHGNDAGSKWVLAGVAATFYGVLGLLTLGWWGLMLAPLSLAWWVVLRRSKQARVELDYMDTINPPFPRLRDVLAAHYYTGWLTCLSLILFNYSSPLGKRLGWNHGRFWDCRRPTEIATGLTGDIIILIIMGAL